MQPPRRAREVGTRKNENRFRVYESPPRAKDRQAKTAVKYNAFFFIYYWQGAASGILGISHFPDLSQQLALVVATCLKRLVDVVRALLCCVEALPLHSTGNNRKRRPRHGQKQGKEGKDDVHD